MGLEPGLRDITTYQHSPMNAYVETVSFALYERTGRLIKANANVEGHQLDYDRMAQPSEQEL